jgi:hypothetical protein
MRYFPDDVVGLDGSESSSELSSSGETIDRFNCVNVEGNVERFVAFGVEIVDSLSHGLSDAQLEDVVHGEALDVVLFEIDPLIWVDISDGQQDDVLIGNGVLEPFEAWNHRLGESTGMAGRISVIAIVCAFGGVDEVGVCVDPYHLQVFMMRVESMNGGTADRVISPNSHNNTFRMSFQPLHDLFINSPQKGIQERQIPYKMCFLFGISLLLLPIFRADITEIDDLDCKLIVEPFKELSLPEDVGCLLDSFDLLALPDAGPEVAHLLRDCLFDLVHALLAYLLRYRLIIYSY